MYDIYSWTKFKQKSIWFFSYTNPIAEVVLEYMEDHNIEYVVAWSNNDSIAIYNKWSWIHMHNGNRKYISWLYWIKTLKNEYIFEFDSSAIKHPYYTEFTWRDMYDLLMTAQESWFIEEKDIKINWWFTWTSSTLSQKEKMIVNHVIIYTKKIYNLTTLLDPSADDMKEIQEYSDVSQINAEMIYEWVKRNYKDYMKKIKEKTIWKTNRREVVNTFYN